MKTEVRIEEGAVFVKDSYSDFTTKYVTDREEMIDSSILKSMSDDVLLNLIQKLELEAIARGIK